MNIELQSIYSFHQLGQRESQQDARFPDLDIPDLKHAIFAVCDGVGGSNKGDLASSTVCRSIEYDTRAHRKTDLFNDAKFLDVLGNAFASLDKIADETNKGMATTLVFAAIHSNGILVAHIGDSRIYLIRPEEGIIYRSEDHSIVNGLVRSGNLSPDMVKNHPKRNIITRCISAEDETGRRDSATVTNLHDLHDGDYLLLCTDGVTGEIEDETLLSLLSKQDADIEKYRILREICKNSDDNNTAILIHIGRVDNPRDPGRIVSNSDHEILSIETQKLLQKEDGVRELTVSSDHRNKLKSFFNRIFK